MLSFEPIGGSRSQAFQIVDALQYFCIGVSWGGYESLAIPIQVRDPQSGEKKWIIRLSVGLESIDDFIADLSQALSSGAS